ncbi:MAG: hypothetical protein M3209_04645 [Acidobacteriota bacterium]|nr:hypothetical protein [Acidobacteriota bacterium]
MRNRKSAIACLLLFALYVALFPKTFAQTNFVETIIVDLPNATGAVSFKPQMLALQANAPAPSFSLVNLKQQVTSAGNGFERILFDETNRVLFGYGLKIRKSETDSKFVISFEPLNENALDALNEKFLAASGAKQPFRLLTLPPVSAPQMLADGEAVALDLLVNSQMGIKITDRVRVATNRDTLTDFPVKELTLKDVHLAARASFLKINEETFPVGNQVRRYNGSLLWFYLPEKGFFVVSLEPREGYDFRRIGILNNNKISFRLDDDEYEWTSSEPFLPIEGAWRLWVLHVPNYIPPAVALSTGIKPNEEFEKSPLEKSSERAMEALKKNPLDLDMSRKSGSIDAARIRKKSPPNQSSTKTRVAVGGAASLDSLLPKN